MLAEAQKAVDDWVRDFEKPYWAPLSIFARLSEEVGEVGRVLNHQYGDKIKKDSEAPDDLAAELADVLFALICLANVHQINLDEAFTKAIEKSRTRDADRFTKKIS
jgi:NTP pyrophosphatase (non-canonical NTP hydrolase)